MKEDMNVGFLPNESSKVLAIADACFNSLLIPTCHTDFNEFVKFIDISVSHGKQTFGRM
jgi:uncharacterized protein YozE (UPF0346 family)